VRHRLDTVVGHRLDTGGAVPLLWGDSWLGAAGERRGGEGSVIVRGVLWAGLAAAGWLVWAAAGAAGLAVLVLVLAAATAVLVLVAAAWLAGRRHGAVVYYYYGEGSDDGDTHTQNCFSGGSRRRGGSLSRPAGGRADGWAGNTAIWHPSRLLPTSRGTGDPSCPEGERGSEGAVDGAAGRRFLARGSGS
jgi:hypothetical protein